MRKSLLLLLFGCWLSTAYGQSPRPFEGYLYNDTYQVYIKMNLYDNDVTIKNQEIFGELPGYFGAKRDTRLWLIVEASVESDHKAVLNVVNDFGSEDFVAQLIYEGDGKYTLKHKSGSTWKIVVNSKYVKIPKVITLTLKEE